MSVTLRDMTAADVLPLDAVLQAAYRNAHSYERRLREGLANPDAHTFVAEVDGEVVGMATLHDYDTLGYIALVGVAPDRQRRGIGRQLTEAVMADSQARGHGALALEASEGGRQLYERLGFVAVAATLTVEGPHDAAAPDDPRIRRASADDCDLIAAYDATAFGGDRSATIRALFARADCAIFIADDGEHIGGYAAACDGRIAPWLAQTPGAAGALLGAAGATLAAGSARAYVPEENLSALAIAARHKLRPCGRNVHMVRGTPLHIPRRSVYGLLSLGEG